jgi:hypothetical protein
MFKSKPRSGAPQKLDFRAARKLVRDTVKEPRTSLKSLGTPSKSGKYLHHRTVAILLKSFGRAKRRLYKKPFLIPLHKQKRRFHYREEKAMKRNNRRVYWSNEVTFEIGEDLRGFWVTRGAGKEEKYTDKNLRPIFKSGRTSMGI